MTTYFSVSAKSWHIGPSATGMSVALVTFPAASMATC